MFHYCAYEIAYILYSLGHIHPIIKEQTLKIVFHFFYAVNKINIAFKTNEAIYFPKLMHQRRRKFVIRQQIFPETNGLNQRENKHQSTQTSLGGVPDWASQEQCLRLAEESSKKRQVRSCFFYSLPEFSNLGKFHYRHFH